MPQHLLDSPEIGASFDKMCGKGMPEGMWTYLFSYSCLCCKISDNRKYHCPCKFPPPAVEKQDILIKNNCQSSPDSHVNINLSKSLGANRNQSLLVTLACYPHDPLTPVNIGKMKVHEFRYPQTATIQCFNNSFVPMAFRFAQVNYSDNFVNFLNRQNLRQFKAYLRRFNK